MPSPFPGFDPFLEDPAYWSDFHARFVNYWCEAIADTLPEEYEARIGERLYLMEREPDARKLVVPDVSAVRNQPASFHSGSTATLEPVTIPVTMLEGPREPYIEILHRPERSLVTVLELLSPANKNQPGRTEYLLKRNALLYQNVHLVELDLLRGGQRVPMASALPTGDAYYYVSRAEQRPDCQVYTWQLAHSLPTLPVPLRPTHSDVLIDLATVFTTAYDRGRFYRIVDYRKLPEQLTESERAWVKQQSDKK